MAQRSEPVKMEHRGTGVSEDLSIFKVELRNRLSLHLCRGGEGCIYASDAISREQRSLNSTSSNCDAQFVQLLVVFPFF